MGKPPFLGAFLYYFIFKIEYCQTFKCCFSIWNAVYTQAAGRFKESFLMQ